MERDAEGDANESGDLLELISRLHRLVHQRFHHRAHRMHGPLGDPYRGQGRILALLKLKPEISQKDLSYLSDMRPQSLGELLAKLENQGFIAREASESDRRAMLIRLTEKGAKASLPDVGQEREALFNCLDEAERIALAGYLERVISALEEQAGQGDGDGRCEDGCRGHGRLRPHCGHDGPHGHPRHMEEFGHGPFTDLPHPPRRHHRHPGDGTHGRPHCGGQPGEADAAMSRGHQRRHGPGRDANDE